MKMETSEEYLLQWKSHNSEIVNEFHNLYKDDQFTDCTIAAEDETFKAHKLILSACSPYFKSLFAKTPCQHPVIFLKDISADHVSQLLKYMYLGLISVKREDLNTILQTANGLRIRGLTTESQEGGGPVGGTVDRSTAAINPAPPPPPPLVSCKEGRKGYVPKKLRAHPSTTAGDVDSVVSSPRASSSEGLVEPEPSGVSPDNGAATPEGSEDSPDEEQPWNLSQNNKDAPPASSSSIGKAKFPILGNYLKNGNGGNNHQQNGSVSKKARTGSIDELLETMRMNHGGTHNNNNISLNSTTTITPTDGRRNSEEVTSNGSSIISSQSLAQSWLEQISSIKGENNTTEDSTPAATNGTVPLQETLGLSGIDIAERIRAMAGPLSQTYGNWLNNAVAASSVAFSTNESTTTTTTATAPSAPITKGEIGEIGPNGKPSVTCEVCGKKLADPSSLYRHRKIHSGDKPHKCPFCSRRFIQRYNMKQHMKTHRIDRIDNPELAAAIASGEYSLPRMAKNV